MPFPSLIRKRKASIEASSEGYLSPLGGVFVKFCKDGFVIFFVKFCNFWRTDRQTDRQRQTDLGIKAPSRSLKTMSFLDSAQAELSENIKTRAEKLQNHSVH